VFVTRNIQYGGSVYVIAGGKGGVGKTTTAVNLGVVLGQGGQSVVVVDADLAMTNLGQRLGIDHGPGIHQVLAGETPVRDAVVRGPGGLAAITGDRELDSFAAADPSEFGRVLDLLSVAYDVVLVDTGPGVQRDTAVTYRAADGVVVVTTPTDVAIEDANRTAAMAADTDCPPVGAVVTQAERGTDRDDVDGLDAEVLAVVPDHETGGPVTASQPAGDAADAYRRVAAALPAVDADAVLPGESEPADEDTPAAEPGRSDVADSDPDESETVEDGENGERADDRGDATSAYRTLTAALPSIGAKRVLSNGSTPTGGADTAGAPTDDDAADSEAGKRPADGGSDGEESSGEESQGDAVTP